MAHVEGGDDGKVRIGPKVFKFTYSFARDGGAVATIPLTGTDPIPSGYVITDALVNVTTILTSGGAAQAAITLESANDVQTAAVISGAPYSAVAAKHPTLVSTSQGVKTTAARTPSVVVSVAALTAGAFDVYLTCIDPSE